MAPKVHAPSKLVLSWRYTARALRQHLYDIDGFVVRSGEGVGRYSISRMVGPEVSSYHSRMGLGQLDQGSISGGVRGILTRHRYQVYMYLCVVCRRARVRERRRRRWMRKSCDGGRRRE